MRFSPNFDFGICYSSYAKAMPDRSGRNRCFEQKRNMVTIRCGTEASSSSKRNKWRVARREEPFMPDLSLNSLVRSATEGRLITSYRDLGSCPGRGLAQVNTCNDVLLATGLGAQNHSDATRRPRRSFTRRHSINSFLGRQTRPLLYDY
jgi:hypothetical protein